MDIRNEQSHNNYPRRVIYCDKERIGGYSVLPNGFRPLGARKVLVSEQDAQFKVIQKYVALHLKLAAKAAELYQEL